MSLARDLYELEAQLRDRRDIDPFRPIERSGLLSASECAPLLERLENHGPMQSASVMRLCLQALRVQHDELRHKLIDAEFVATLPADMPGGARPTQSVVREMISMASREIILLGYEFTDRELVRLLADARSRGVDTIVICDRARGSAQRILEAWPNDVARPKVFRDKKREGTAPYASMHAKSLLVDENDLLVTSANFTFHGMQGNIEIGVRLSGAPAIEARKIFSHLVESHLVEPCS